MLFEAARKPERLLTGVEGCCHDNAGGNLSHNHLNAALQKQLLAPKPAHPSPDHSLHQLLTIPMKLDEFMGGTKNQWIGSLESWFFNAG